MAPWLTTLFQPAIDFLRTVLEKHGLAGLGLCALVAIVALICAVLKHRSRRSAALVIAETNRDLTKRCTPRTVDDVVKLMNANNNSHDRKEIPSRNDEAERRPDPADAEHTPWPSEDGEAM